MKTDLPAQGRLADEKLAAHHLILTQGGEPTFVPHDPSAPEWNLAALGPEKLLFARRLAKNLATTLFPGSVVLQSFGKQYPGEPLPRWQIGIFRSRGGEPVWKDLDRLRLDQETLPPADPENPRQLIAELAAALDLEDTSVPAYEDLESRLKVLGSEQTKALLPRFSRRKRAFVSKPLPDSIDADLESYFTPAGWMLPLSHEEGAWVTGAWELPDDNDLTLWPGDSPVGLRLPLDQLPEDALKCGLSVEIKDGELIVFLPPLPTFAAFVELVRLIETLAEKLGLPPLRLEGYTPKREADRESIELTSDPGVLEVNLPPADNWPDYERVFRGLFDSAEAVGMRSYKYQVSGRRVSTGGGAHIVLGGPDLEHNPFIQRPTLLSSFLRFLQHHPSLSYTFSGLFIGPSSQAPRVDESAFELPYELEISLQALEEMAEPGDPVMIDALLRNLLMDWNGNTHRAELSVDKFHNVNTPGGCNGLIEFRAFEMAATPEPPLVANLALRALAACFAETPYTAPLKDWREALHDRFLLPWFLEQDQREVTAFLNDHGFTFAEDLFEEQLAFRFPEVIAFESGEVRWSLRQAVEPWPVMGEHEGTGRVVDSTTDRLELRAEGGVEQAGLFVSANGVRVPLHPVADGVAVGAIRYRLFDNPWGLQPHVPAHTPLHIAVVDEATLQVVHAFDYFNWKLLGFGYDGLPLTAEEARSRVDERLVPREDLVGSTVEVTELPSAPHAPFTLDLRRGLAGGPGTRS